ncbi:MAG: hypothetical protein KatS3mg011_1795 [Acidimicrobiia bacterium]|nr:MAG: hypothetical protein KatS3mg011_1795 [Acidimicrobiia bacterium]
MAEGTVQTIEIDAPAEACFQVAADVAAYPEWATGVRSTEVLEVDQEGRPRRARFEVDAGVKAIRYVLRYTYDPPHRIEWEAEPGPDLEELVGSYTFRDIGEGRTEVVYALKARPRFSLPGFLRRQAEKQVVGTALRGLRRRVEELAAR